MLSTFTAALAVAASATAMAPAPGAAQAAPRPSIALASFTQALPESLTAGVSTAVPTSKVQSTLDRADDAIAASSDVTADIAASKLDVGTDATTIDTGDLADSVDELENIAAIALLDNRRATEAVEDEITAVSEQTSSLRGRLDAAIEKEKERVAEEKRKAEAAARAAAEKKAAEEAAAAAAEEAAEQSSSSNSSSSRSSSSGSSAPATGGSVGGTSPADAQATARGMLGNYGWGDDQFSCLVSLWNKESGWNYRASNSSSGAYGIPQALPGSKMSSAGSDWQSNPATQIAWGLGYIDGRYGSPCGAWNHSQSNGWY